MSVLSLRLYSVSLYLYLLQGWAPEREPVEAAANMMITRVAFDLLRAPSFRAAAAAYVQKKLDQLRYPAYIGPLKVCVCTIQRNTATLIRAVEIIITAL